MTNPLDEIRLSEANAVLWPLCFGCDDPINLTMSQLIEGLEAAQMSAPFHGVQLRAAITGLKSLEQSAWLAHTPPSDASGDLGEGGGEGEGGGGE